MNNKLFLLIAVIVVGLVACEKSNDSYGPGFNAQRQKIGLPIISSGWYSIKGTTWVNPERESKYSQHIPVYFSKSIVQKGGKLISETDLYYGSMEYTLADESFREYIEITYYYSEDGVNAKWSVSLHDQSSVKSGIFEISLEKAEEILKKWGISRLDGLQTLR